MGVLKKMIAQWSAHSGPAMAAAIAFYTLFSMAPILVFAIAVASAMLGNASAHSAALSWLGAILGKEQAQTLLELVRDTDFTQQGLIPSLIAGGTLIWGASAAFVQLRRALTHILGFTDQSSRGRIRTTIKGRAIAAIFAIAAALVLVVGTAASALARHLATRVAPWEGVADEVLEILLRGGSWLLIALVFAALLRYMPIRQPPWRHVIPAVVLATVLFKIGQYAIQWYLARSLIASAYGPGSSIVGIILWIYYSAQALLISAEFCRYRMENETQQSRDRAQAG